MGVSPRALQLALGAPPLVKIDKNATVIEVAEKEFEKKALPMAVLRNFPTGEIQRVG